MAKGTENVDRSAVEEVLLALRSELRERVRGLDKDVHHREEPIPADFAEQAVALENQEVLEALDEDARVELEQINQALQRLEEGVYGSCASCGEAIAPERLHAIAWAILCIDCASLAEQKPS